MKTVFSTSFEVAHLFANKSHKTAKCRNTSIDYWQSDLYGEQWKYKSYNAVIAEFITGADGSEAILHNDYRYSNTTAKHQWEVQAATRQHRQFFTSQTDLQEVMQEVNIIMTDKLPTAKSKKQDYIDRILFLHSKVLEYAAFTGNENYAVDTRIKDLELAVKTVSDAETLNLNNADIRKEKKKEAQLKKEYAAYRAKQQQAEYQEKIGKFLAGEKVDIYMYDYAGEKEDFLRISKDGQFVETSMRVRIPVKDAAILYKMILAGKDIKGYNISGYTVISINGHLKVGCHNINIENMHEVGKKIVVE